MCPDSLHLGQIVDIFARELGVFFCKAGFRPVITLTEAALGECRRQLLEQDDSSLGVRISLRPGGCAGTKYVVECAALEDATDRVFEQDGVRVFCDAASLPSLDGLQIDFVQALMGGGFRFTNPQAVSCCACGDSFATG